MTTDADLDDDVLAAARAAARAINRQYPHYAEYEDFYQEGLLWAWTHPQRVEHARLEDGKIYHQQLVSEILRYLVPRAKRAKAQALGVSSSHQSRYTYEAVEAVLTGVWDPTPTPTPGSQETAGRGRPDPAYGGNYQVSLMDVRGAVEKVLSRNEQRALFSVYHLGATGRAGQHFSGVPRGDLEAVTRRAIQTVTNYLNDEPPEFHSGPGARRTVSNAQARAMTDNSYAGD